MKRMSHNKRHTSKIRFVVLYVFAFSAYFCLSAASGPAQVAPFPFPGAKPADIPESWKPLIGEYGPPPVTILLNDGSGPPGVHPFLIVLEKSGKLVLLERNGTETSLRPAPEGTFTLVKSPGAPSTVFFGQAADGQANGITFDDNTFLRGRLGPEEGQSFHITPPRSIDQLRQEALVVAPPHEPGQFRVPDLVDLIPLNPAIHLDIRYATSNDFLGTPVYTQARAFLQRPAADALGRALHHLKPFGYGLLIHDAYRPWYVTKIFWDATPLEGKIFVADPAQGSRHNRGCAVDLTLYELKTGKPIEMPGTYDEMSPRSFPDYPGGTSLQRWHRDLLRWAMESEGFTVYEHEWWHFDFKDWHEYPILNVPFEKLQFSEKQVR